MAHQLKIKQYLKLNDIIVLVFSQMTVIFMASRQSLLKFELEIRFL